jgi:hypothetical protein
MVVVGYMKILSILMPENYASHKAVFFADREDFGRRMESFE